MHAAQIRGLTFTSLSDFIEPQPFWQMITNGGSKNKIISHALTIPDEGFKQLLLDPNANIIWISVEDVLFQRWENKSERMIWHEIFTLELNNIFLASGAEQEIYILNDVLGDY
ncbi:hypothetical protein BIY29_18800 [Brenneria alni]|uniref:Uncharacterized protein n=1 Tax=Brenneria alni TaxID=71656 RepID=A0A421DIZ7_9GAMM|nr:hypothetical protein [Brenneria alni]RLM17948.1 hypothetical protein BIY29_18800 [Brenneria alni]